MAITKTVTLYTFDELSETAKERAREWGRQVEEELFFAHGFPDGDDIETIAGILGVTFRRHDVPLMGGGTRSEPEIFVSLDYSHVPGCAFNAQYEYARGCAQKIREYAPKDSKLHQMADSLVQIQKPAAFGLTAVIRDEGREPHPNNMRAEVEHKSGRGPTDAEEGALLDIMRDFARWIYNQVESEFIYRLEDEQIDDMLRANEYTFTEDGKRED